MGDVKTPRFSLVVPAYNEEAYLPRLLETVGRACSRYSGGGDAIEVIVADNASTDGTAQIARELGCRVVPVAKRVIAASRNGGARAARGEILCFVDADFRIHPETFNAIDRAMATGKIIGGASGVELERWSLGLAVTYAALAFWAVLLRANVGVVFCGRRDFEAIGGYDERRRFAEDVQFLWDLRRRGWRKGQRLSPGLPAKAIASTRKFDKHGDWHYFTKMLRVPFVALLSPSSTTDFAERYWYRDR